MKELAKNMHVGSIPERGGFCFLVPRQIQTLRPHVKQKCFTKYVARIYEVVKLKKLRAVLRASFLLGPNVHLATLRHSRRHLVQRVTL